MLEGREESNITKMENYKEMLSIFLPEGILEYFECTSVRVVEKVITVRLEEKPWVPEIPKEHRGKKIISKGFKDFSVDDFPVRGKKVQLLLRRRVFQIEGVPKLLKRELNIVFPQTHLETGFAIFLKE